MSMKLEVEFNQEQIDNIVKQELIAAYQLFNVVDVDNADNQEYDLKWSLARVIEYYSSPEEFAEFEKQNVPM